MSGIFHAGKQLIVTAKNTLFNNTNFSGNAANVQDAIEQLDNNLTSLMNYSIEEKIVGKWVDETTDVFERTFIAENTLKTTSSNLDTFSFTLAENIVNLISAKGSWVITIGGVDYTFAYGSGCTNGSLVMIRSLEIGLGNGILKAHVNEKSSSSATKAKIQLTIQYTK